MPTFNYNELFIETEWYTGYEYDQYRITSHRRGEITSATLLSYNDADLIVTHINLQDNQARVSRIDQLDQYGRLLNKTVFNIEGDITRLESYQYNEYGINIYFESESTIISPDEIRRLSKRVSAITDKYCNTITESTEEGDNSELKIVRYFTQSIEYHETTSVIEFSIYE